MRTRVYKTLKGYLKAVGHNYVNADYFFNDRIYCYNTTGSKWYAVPSDELRATVAIAFEKYHWSKSNATRLESLKAGHYADFKFLHCFYVGSYDKDAYYFGNLLSGDAYDYCKRMFTKSAY